MYMNSSGIEPYYLDHTSNSTISKSLPKGVPCVIHIAYYDGTVSLQGSNLIVNKPSGLVSSIKGGNTSWFTVVRVS